MIVILASGEGTNFSAIIESGIKIDMLLTNNPKANVINRAKKKVTPKPKRKNGTPTIKVKEPNKKPEVTVDMSQYVDPNEIKNLKSKLKRPLQRRK